MCKGMLDLYCLECHRTIRWRKEHVVRDDGYYDWRIVVACGCGEIVDRETAEIAQAAYEIFSEDAIYAAQEEAMERVLGPDLHAQWNKAMKLWTRWTGRSRRLFTHR